MNDVKEDKSDHHTSPPSVELPGTRDLERDATIPAAEPRKLNVAQFLFGVAFWARHGLTRVHFSEPGMSLGVSCIPLFQNQLLRHPI